MTRKDLSRKVAKIWDAFAEYGLTDDLEIVEQITYLLIMRRLDNEYALEQSKTRLVGKPVEDPIFADCEQEVRWSEFKHLDPEKMLVVVREKSFGHLLALGARLEEYAILINSARFLVTSPQLLAKVVDTLDSIDMMGSGVFLELYEEIINKLPPRVKNEPRKTPHQIVELIVSMISPAPQDMLLDPACGTGSFLATAVNHLRSGSTGMFSEDRMRDHFRRSAFSGFDNDPSMARVAMMRLLLCGVGSPPVRCINSLGEDYSVQIGQYSLVMSNPPFKGSVDLGSVRPSLRRMLPSTKNTALLFLVTALESLAPGGRAAIVVPQGVLFETKKASLHTRRLLVEENKLDAVVQLPAGCFSPVNKSSTAILFFTKTLSGGTGDVWFYNIESDGWSLDDKREPLLDPSKLGPMTTEELVGEEHQSNNLPDVLRRWRDREGEASRRRDEQSFLVPKGEIVEADYDLTFNRYREIVSPESYHEPPSAIIDELKSLEREISSGLVELEGLLGSDVSE